MPEAYDKQFTPDDYVGTAEVEFFFAVPKHRVIRFLKRGLWPKPIAELRCGLVFRTAEVKDAIAQLKLKGHL